MSYAGIQAIRQAAGVLDRNDNETPVGVANGSNVAFTTKRRPIVDRDNDGLVTTSDITAYVNGSPVTVNAVNPTTGQITLQAAPASNASVTVDYYFSGVPDTIMTQVQAEADSWVDAMVAGHVTTPVTPVPGLLVTAAKMYGAGILLTVDWGLRVDSEQTSKDGYAKIKLARDLIADYLAGLKAGDTGSDEANGNTTQVSATSDPDVFDRCPPFLGDPTYSNTDDEGFNRPFSNYG